MRFLYLFAKRFIAGEDLDAAIERAKQLRRKHLRLTIDILGEDVENIIDARHAVVEYQKLIDRIKKENLDATISLKLTHLGLSLNEHICKINLLKILDYAEREKVSIEIDMESSQYTTSTIKLYTQITKKYPTTMITIQSYLKRSKKDILSILKKRPSIRLVKGAYQESHLIAFENKKDVDQNYEELMYLLLTKAKHTHIATHDETLIRKALRFIQKNHIPEEQYEFAFLLGIKKSLQIKLARDGYSVRIYLPYGEEWLPYVLRRIRERKENLFFVLRNIFSQ
ncbi:proline dehydrogenase family protein [Candidatus Woesearchaeota archaeon]|nr:proline dehydrogenase family protein [Candidatus Woesearchaeota archaeon]